MKNLWNQVEDFKWLKSEPSPHWSITKESARLDESFWSNDMENEDVEAKSILKVAGLA